MRDDRVVIVGGGIGGLSAALSLAANGVGVRLFEALPHLGGKIRQAEAGGHLIDTGPTVFTMKWVFDEMLADAGTSLEAHLRLSPLEVLARHAWQDGQRLDLFADAARSADAIGAFSGADDARGFLRFCDRAARVYGHLKDSFICQPEPRFDRMLLNFAFRPGALWDISPYTSLWAALGAYFRDPRLQQLFGRYATYCGSSPFEAPATLMLVAHVEQAGVWSIDGGMSALARALADLATARGAVMSTHAPVDTIVLDGSGAAGVRITTGELVEADAIIWNGDIASLTHCLPTSRTDLAPAPPARESRSLSALTWVTAARTEGFPLSRHNVFFSNDYRAEFDDILRRRGLPHDPTIYLCAGNRSGSAHADQGGTDETDRLLCLVNAPADGDRNPLSAEDIAQCRTTVQHRLEAQGLQLAETTPWTLTGTPAIFDTMFPATGGALYGPASHGWSASFSRAGITTRTTGLYLAGGSVHPGPGVPMAALSGRMAARQVMAHLASRRRFRQAVTPGGTSTR
ncbi:MAG: phytoene desaturase [Hyphomicrobiales bacterium]|nr:MAG: phytoene desaturase [Hyphomicrobiales bacterium]